MKEALYYKKLENNLVQCQLCPNFCILKPDERSKCNTRQNKNGKLYSLVYGKLTATHPDPIEKKPLYHVLPGTNSLSIATAGCTLHCTYCQNFTLSQSPPEYVSTQEFFPIDIIKKALETNCHSIAYTYTEPTVFYEFMLETAKLAKEHGLLNVIVSNGYINQKPLKELSRYIDAANIDLKAFTQSFYKDVCSGSLQPVLETLKRLKRYGVWIEITNLIIPTLNDDMKKIKEMCAWIKHNLTKKTPLHFSRFFPMYKLQNLPPTPEETLKKAKEIADKYLDYVYLGNLDKEANTYCPHCKTQIIKRVFYYSTLLLKNGKCPNCNTKIPGIWNIEPKPKKQEQAL